eukprot:1138503-Pelagomonas_calceolata.AAC.12
MSPRSPISKPTQCAKAPQCVRWHENFGLQFETTCRCQEQLLERTRQNKPDLTETATHSESQAAQRPAGERQNWEVPMTPEADLFLQLQSRPPLMDLLPMSVCPLAPESKLRRAYSHIKIFADRFVSFLTCVRFLRGGIVLSLFQAARGPGWAGETLAEVQPAPAQEPAGAETPSQSSQEPGGIIQSIVSGLADGFQKLLGGDEK